MPKRQTTIIEDKRLMQAAEFLRALAIFLTGVAVGLFFH